MAGPRGVLFWEKGDTGVVCQGVLILLFFRFIFFTTFNPWCSTVCGKNLGHEVSWVWTWLDSFISSPAPSSERKKERKKDSQDTSVCSLACLVAAKWPGFQTRLRMARETYEYNSSELPSPWCACFMVDSMSSWYFTRGWEGNMSIVMT